jgi:hypothetical protein
VTARVGKRRTLFRRSGVLGMALTCSASSRALSEPVLKWMLLAVGLVPLVIGITLFVKGLKTPANDRKGMDPTS